MSTYLALPVMALLAAVQASRRSEGLARSFWGLVAVAYSLLGTAQCLSVYNDLAASSPVSWINNLLFCFWFVPLAMWLTPGQSDGQTWRVLLGFSVWVVVLAASWRPASPILAFRRPEPLPTS